MNIITLAIMISLIVIVFVGGGNMIMTPPINAQQNLTSSSSSSPSQNTTSNAAAEEKTYILVFGQRTVGNIDNSTKIVSSIVGNDSLKIEEEFLEEISLEPSQQLEEQINKVVNDGINGSSCNGISLTTQQEVSVSVDCISTGNRVIWYVYPIP
jgi:predicted aldo/keto reductase-like oxidoreductase